MAVINAVERGLDCPWGPPSLVYSVYRVYFPEIMLPVCDVNHSPPSSVDVKERVELYLYSLSLRSRQVVVCLLRCTEEGST